MIQKLSLAFLILCLSAACFAPIKDMRPGLKPQAESTQAQLAEQQKRQRVQGQVGIVPENTDPKDVQMPVSSGQAKDVLASAGNMIDSGDTTKKTLSEATDRVKESQESPVAGYGLWTVVFLLLGLAGAFGFRMWAGKAIPDVPKRVNW